jgi:hypothetical protein
LEESGSFEEFNIKIKELFNSVIFLYNIEYDEKLKHYDNGTYSFDYQLHEIIPKK